MPDVLGNSHGGSTGRNFILFAYSRRKMISFHYCWLDIHFPTAIICPSLQQLSVKRSKQNPFSRGFLIGGRGIYLVRLIGRYSLMQ